MDEETQSRNRSWSGAGGLAGAVAGLFIGLAVNGGLSALVFGLLAGSMTGAGIGRVLIGRTDPADWDPPPPGDRSNVGMNAPDYDLSDGNQERQPV